MAPRAYWTGNLKLSLVSVPVRVYNAVTEAEKVRLNQIHKGCNQRLKFPAVCPTHGQVDRSEISKAYEFEKDKYVVIEPEELDKIKLRTEKTIELTAFVPVNAVEEVYFDSTYWVGPDGPLAIEPFRVIRAALEQTKTAAIGRVAFSGRERAVILKGEEQGFALTTLHTATEVRDSAPYFEEIGAGKVASEHLELAVNLIKSKMGKFEPAEFRDRYQDALVELVKSKVEGQEPIYIQEQDIPTTYNFMEALQQSLRGQGVEPAASAAAAPSKSAAPKKAAGKKPPAKSVSPAEAKPQRKRKQA